MDIKLLFMNTFVYNPAPCTLKTICYFIDDDQDDHLFFQLALRAIDPTIHLVIESSGSVALMKLQQDELFFPSYIFLDLNLPHLDGKIVLAKLQEIPRLRNVPIIIYSTSNYPGDVIACKELGAVGYIVKPNGYNEIVHILRNVLDMLSSSTNFFITDDLKALQ